MSAELTTITKDKDKEKEKFTGEFNGVIISNEMQRLIEECKNTIIKATDLMDKICKQGINDGLKPKEIQEIVFEVFKEAYSKRHIIRLMPKELKNQNMVRNRAEHIIIKDKELIELRLTPSLKIDSWKMDVEQCSPELLKGVPQITTVSRHHGRQQDGTRHNQVVYEMMSPDKFKSIVENPYQPQKTVYDKIDDTLSSNTQTQKQGLESLTIPEYWDKMILYTKDKFGIDNPEGSRKITYNREKSDEIIQCMSWMIDIMYKDLCRSNSHARIKREIKIIE